MSSQSTIILITGANSGIGYAASKVIASTSTNYHVIMASRSPEKGRSALAELRSAPGIKGSLSTLQLDVNSQDSINAAVKHVTDTFDRLDVLINNAGVYSKSSDLRTELEETFTTNVYAPALVTEAFKPLLLKSKRPYLLYISSRLASLTLATTPVKSPYDLPMRVYGMSKAALNMLMIYDEKELRQHGVKVFAVCPGLVVSNLRGPGEYDRSAAGVAGDPEVSGRTILRVIEGERDADVGKFVYKDGVYPW